MVCSVDQLASAAGTAVLADGGNAVDAAIAANAVLTVTSQHMCGLGGDLFAMVHVPGAGGPPATLNASGRSGSGADADRERARGLSAIPHRGSTCASPVPGCVDGWEALHQRFGTLPMSRLLRDAIDLATHGFAASELLAASSINVADVPNNHHLAAVQPGQVVVRPGVARTLEAIVVHGRAGFYGGEFGDALISLGDGEYTSDDLAESNADWVDPIVVDVWGHHVWTTPPNTQGYLSLAGAWIASGLALPDNVDDPLWAHLMIESARAAAFDRPEMLHEHANGAALVSAERLGPRQALIDSATTRSWGDRHTDGGTMYLCTTDDAGMGVSLIQSNANGFGAHLVVGETDVFLHNRGIGFSLVEGHPAEYGPRRRPPHTLSPALVTRADGSLRSVLGTMGGDAQPQIVQQMLARMLLHDQPPGQVLDAGRFVLASPDPLTGFDTWSAGGDVRVVLEPHAEHWVNGLTDRGHRVEIGRRPSSFGHAHLIESTEHGWAGAADPRAVVGAALGR